MVRERIRRLTALPNRGLATPRRRHRPLSALHDGLCNGRAEQAPNVRYYVLRALVCRAALGPLSALRVAAGLVSIPYFTKQPVFPQGAPAQASIIPFRGAAPPSLGGLPGGCVSTRDPFALGGP